MKKIEKYVMLGMLFLVVTAVFLGCDEGMNMVKPVVSEPAEPPLQQEGAEQPESPAVTMGDMKSEGQETPAITEDEVEEPESIVEMDPTTQEPEIPQQPPEDQPVRPGEVALSEEAAREKAYTIARELYPIYVMARQTGMYEKFDAEVLEKMGFDALHLQRTLGAITREEDPTTVEFYENASNSPMHFLAEYFRLTLQYPEKTEGEILELFRQLARDGLIVVYRLDVELELGIIEQEWLDAGEIAYRIWDEIERLEDDLSIETAEEFHKLADAVCIEKSGLSFFSYRFMNALYDTYFGIHPENRVVQKHLHQFFVERRITWEFLYVAFKNPKITGGSGMLGEFDKHLRNIGPIFFADHRGEWKIWHEILFLR